VPVYFKVSGEWSTAEAPAVAETGVSVAALSLLLLGLLYVAPVIIAVRNLRRGRGDRKAAIRFALVIFVGKLLAFLLGADFTWDLAFFGRAIGSALHYAMLFWVMYMAVEPLIRRIFPQSMIAWSRVMTGNVKDPLVGRDLLLGTALGVVWLLLVQAVLFIASSQAGAPPRAIDLRPVLSPLFAAGTILDAAMLAGIAPVFVALIFVLTRSLIQAAALRTTVECFLLSLFFASRSSSP
jgi:hypothetical protein